MFHQLNNPFLPLSHTKPFLLYTYFEVVAELSSIWGEVLRQKALSAFEDVALQRALISLDSDTVVTIVETMHYLLIELTQNRS